MADLKVIPELFFNLIIPRLNIKVITNMILIPPPHTQKNFFFSVYDPITPAPKERGESWVVLPGSFSPKTRGYNKPAGHVTKNIQASKKNFFFDTKEKLDGSIWT